MNDRLSRIIGQEAAREDSLYRLVSDSGGYPVYHSKKKHRRRYHFTRRLVEDGDVFAEG